MFLGWQSYLAAVMVLHCAASHTPISTSLQPHTLILLTAPCTILATPPQPAVLPIPVSFLLSWHSPPKKPICNSTVLQAAWDTVAAAHGCEKVPWQGARLMLRHYHTAVLCLWELQSSFSYLVFWFCFGFFLTNGQKAFCFVFPQTIICWQLATLSKAQK